MKKLKQVPVTTEKVVEKVTTMQDTIVDEEGGLIPALGKTIMLHCMNYNYKGKLTGVNTVDIELSDAMVVFETGAYDPKHPGPGGAKFHGEGLPSVVTITRSSIEAWWVVP